MRVDSVKDFAYGAQIVVNPMDKVVRTRQNPGSVPHQQFVFRKPKPVEPDQNFSVSESLKV